MGKGNKFFIYLIFFVAVSIRLCFYISSTFTHSLDKYFLSVTQGQDFFQIPNGARDFLKGGSLVGNNHSYIDCCVVNDNVYHPLFTLLVGIPLQLFQPWTAFYFWSAFHLVIDIFIIIFLFKKFQDHQLLIPSLVFYLISSLSYYEIVNNQYHFLLNLFTLLLLYKVSTDSDSYVGGIFFFLGLLVKPIGIFWAIPLILGKYYKTVFFGLILFFITTIPFYYFGIGKYYFDNLYINIFNINFADWNIFFVPHYFGLEINSVKIIKYFLMATIVLFSVLNKKKVFISIVLWICFVLLTYHNSFPYHFSIITTIVPLAILFKYRKLDLMLIVNMLILVVPVLFIQTISEKFVIFNPDIDTNKKLLFLVWVYLGLIMFCSGLIFSPIKNRKK